MRKGNLTDKYTEYIASCIATTKPKALCTYGTVQR